MILLLLRFSLLFVSCVHRETLSVSQEYEAPGMLNYIRHFEVYTLVQFSSPRFNLIYCDLQYISSLHAAGVDSG
uniref:Secreted protein n=1 Tax=Noccaea caerulescens TaxID=107243 RepID=A0A1J3IWM4_NOCCA